MQCYQRQAMYLKLNFDAVLKIPELEFDPLLLDEVLSDFSIEDFYTLITLDKRQRDELIAHLETLICEKALCGADSEASQAHEDKTDPTIHGRYHTGHAINRLAS